MQQEQFLDVIDRDEAERRFRSVLNLKVLESEAIPLAQALGRVLAADILAPVDVPAFDRSNVDGYAVRAADTFGAAEETPRRLMLNNEAVAIDHTRRPNFHPSTATAIATGGVVPRGADAVVMIEDTECQSHNLLVCRPVAPGANITFAGTDIGRGEAILRRGALLTSRETCVLAALGLSRVPVVRRPRVAIVSTGDELLEPGAPLTPGRIYDSNSTILADAVRELGGLPISFGIVPDNAELLRQTIRPALEDCDAVILTGGTSKGAGDISYRVVGELGPPGIVAHGVALKPGKPICLAAVRISGPGSAQRTVPVAVLPGFPTSAIFTFREFIAPVLRVFAGRDESPLQSVHARLPVRVNSERGRTEYVLVNLIEDSTNPCLTARPAIAYPLAKGSGSVTAFSGADGYIVIPRQTEYVEAGQDVSVHLLSPDLRIADLVIIGSHCVGLDYLVGRLAEQGLRTKAIWVGSTGGLLAASRGECDLAGCHLLHPETNTYNRPYLNDSLVLVSGYGRVQGIVHRPADHRFVGRTVAEAIEMALADSDCMMVNRNRGSGTRVLIERLLRGRQPPGYLIEARSHNAVAAAVAQGKADWGVAIVNVARDLGLGFSPIQDEQYDFVVPRSRLSRPAVQAFCTVLHDTETRLQLIARGFNISSPA